MATSTGFVTPSPVRPFFNVSVAKSARRPIAGNVVTAVLDTPASNTYLQRHAEVALRDFLTRRAVNTVLFYMYELHDGVTHRWLREFEQFERREKDDSFKDGDEYLSKMLRAQDEEGTIKVGPARFARTYTFEISPRKIARRILETRTQLSGEWETDLNWVELDNLEMQRIGFEKLVCSSEKEVDSKRNIALESDPWGGGGQTPLRWANYQKLKTLVTRHAVARLLPYIRDQGPNHEYMYLLAFVREYGEIAKGDDFVQTLMNKPIEHRTNPEHTIIPRAIALQLMELRKAIAEEWIEVMKIVPEEQQLLDRDLLEQSLRASHTLGEDVRRPGTKEEGSAKEEESADKEEC